ncbi:HNH endonuclease signature motif containing protein [Spirulina sp. CS-785/01]|uniref:HNH endonuclease n=1 Tax=Spirulina sp. CS-785/01 TaxID=3021716 RepID=UPI00232E9662|nr:HNH endonuclease signature motif containing protein [Spirulina sp. CS-785/01]MDB9313326.1 HNH endonuclease signature motif containing protein [Spirulina sp. CS-785/01]
MVQPQQLDAKIKIQYTYSKVHLYKTMRRCFSQSQKLHLLRLAGYRCQNCGIPLTPNNTAADHRIPYSKQGATQVWNGQALCMQCNAKKGDQIVISNQ